MNAPQPVCLTFDNGPEPEATPLVLDVLARRGVPATFFVVGEKLRDPARRRLAERARAEGHAVGNHTLTHGRPLGLRGGAEAVREIAEADALIGALAASPPLFRPNGGGGALGPHLLNRSAAAHLLARGHTVVLWNAVPRDWDDPDGWPGRALALWRAAAAPLAMVLHDLPGGGAMRHLDRVLGAMLDAGAAFTPGPPGACVPIRDGRWAVPPSDVTSEDPAP